MKLKYGKENKIKWETKKTYVYDFQQYERARSFSVFILVKLI